jgi:inosine-uridine nucleoside N-ribohydrolase
MKIHFSVCIVLVLMLLASCSGSNTKPVNLILDTDLGPDYDDVGAMALLHALADSGQVNILATLSSNKDERVIPCMEVLNTYFNRPSIPVGAPKSEGGVSLTAWHKTKWTDVLPARYKHATNQTSDAPDAVKIYRQVLSKQDDQSVVICSIGFFTNLKNLLLSEADEYSPLSGKELVARKVKQLVSMAAKFPEGKETNIYGDTPASIIVMRDWPAEIILSGYEIGFVIRTGKKVVQMPVENSPVKDVYSMCLAEDIVARASYDQTAVLVAIKGYESYFSTERGTVNVNSDGYNTWTPDENGRHVRLMQKLPPEQLASIIETCMMHQLINKQNE